MSLGEHHHERSRAVAEPDDAGAAMHDLHHGVARVEGDGRIEVGHAQGDVGQTVIGHQPLIGIGIQSSFR